MPNLGIWSVFLFSFWVVRWERGTKPDGYKPKVPRTYRQVVLKPENTCFSTNKPRMNGTKPARYKLSIPPVHGRLVLKQVKPTISTIPPGAMVLNRMVTGQRYHAPTGKWYKNRKILALVPINCGRMVLKQVKPTISTIPPGAMVLNRIYTSQRYHAPTGKWY